MTYSKTRLPVLLILALLALSGGILTQPAQETPASQTPAAKRFFELLEVVNSGDQARIRGYVQDNFAASFLKEIPLEEHVGVLTQVHNESRGFTFHSFREVAELKVSAYLRNTLTDGWLLVSVHVEAAPPHRIEGAGIMMSPPPPGFVSTTAVSAADFPRVLDGYIAKLVEADVFSGAFLVAQDGRPIFRKAYGLASRDYQVPNREDTKFNLGSMNKMFTAVAVAQLVEKGQLSYDDPVSKHLGGEWIRPEAGAKIKVSHLLSHTSGLGDYFNEKFMNSSRLLYRYVSDYKPLVAGDAPAFEPGTKWQYSNTGFLLLGAIIEKVTGRRYFDYVKENIFGPAGMVNTDSYELDKVVPNLAVGYEKVTAGAGTEWRNNIFDHVVKGGPAGGGYSTVDDLLSFDQALRSNTLISAASRELLMSAKPEFNSPNYGYGFGVGTKGRLGRFAGHSGGFTGISSKLEMYLDTGYTLVVLSNTGRGMMPVFQKAVELLNALK